MRIATVILLLGAIVLLAACNLNRSEDAMKLSKQVTSVNDSLTWYGKQWHDELHAAVSMKDFSQLGAVRQDMHDFIERRIIDINTMRDVGDSKDFRKAELALLTFDRDSILPRFIVFEGYDKTTPDEEIAEAYKVLWLTFKNEQPRLNKVDTMLNRYAEDNDFPKPVNPYPEMKNQYSGDTATTTAR